MTTALSTADLQRKDARHHLHPFSDHDALNAAGSRVITRAEGVWLWDSEGNRILDGMAGLWCVNIGHGRADVADAVSEQMRSLSYYNTFFKTTHPPAVALSERLADITPDGFHRVFFTNSGSEANDTVLRMARTYWQLRGRPEKSIIISRKNAYHGSTVAGSCLSGMDAMHGQGRFDDGLAVPGIHHIDQPYWFDEGGDTDPDTFGLERARALERAIDTIGEDKIAAFIAEPIQGAGGVIVPPATYWPEVSRILAERDILFAADEVICGFGRTGSWFGCDTYHLSPHFMSLAKGLSSGYLPIGGVMVHDDIAETISAGGEFFHGFTYSGHPAACAAAIANLDILHRESIVERVRSDIGPYLRDRWLSLADHPLVGEARIVGLIGALELVPNKPERRRFANYGDVGTRCRDIAFQNGLVMRAVRDSMIIAPPLVLTRDEADQLIALVTKTLDDTHADLRQSGLL